MADHVLLTAPKTGKTFTHARPYRMELDLINRSARVFFVLGTDDAGEFRMERGTEFERTITEADFDVLRKTDLVADLIAAAQAKGDI